MEMGVLSVAERAAFLPSRAFPHAALSFPLPFLVLPSPPRCRRGITFTCRARRKNSYSEPALKREPIEVAGEAEEYEEEVEEEDTDFDVEMFDDEMPEEDDENFEDDLEAEDVEPYIGDGGSGGGVNLSGTTWDKEALAIAEGVALSFDGDLKIYAFKTSARPSIQVRIEKLSNKSGSPGMSDIEAFTSVYQARLDEAAVAGCIPDNLFLEDIQMKQMIGGGVEQDGLYYLNLPTIFAGATSISSDPLLWHLHLGHPSVTKLRQMFPDLAASYHF